MKSQATMLDTNYASSFGYALGTLYKMAGKMLKLVFQQSFKIARVSCFGATRPLTDVIRRYKYSYHAT